MGGLLPRPSSHTPTRMVQDLVGEDSIMGTGWYSSSVSKWGPKGCFSISEWEHIRGTWGSMDQSTQRILSFCFWHNPAELLGAGVLLNGGMLQCRSVIKVTSSPSSIGSEGLKDFVSLNTAAAKLPQLRNVILYCLYNYIYTYIHLCCSWCLRRQRMGEASQPEKEKPEKHQAPSRCTKHWHEWVLFIVRDHIFIAGSCYGILGCGCSNGKSHPYHPSYYIR